MVAHLSAVLEISHKLWIPIELRFFMVVVFHCGFLRLVSASADLTSKAQLDSSTIDLEQAFLCLSMPPASKLREMMVPFFLSLAMLVTVNGLSALSMSFIKSRTYSSLRIAVMGTSTSASARVRFLFGFTPDWVTVWDAAF